MKTLLVLNRDKRAVSIIVSYVLLITMTLALSVLVYNWLKFYTGESEVPECSSNVNIIIKEYQCYPSSMDPDTGVWTPGNIQITLKNKGLFNVSGFHLRVHDREDAEFGLYPFKDEGGPLAPGDEDSHQYDFEDFLNQDLKKITIVQVQPFIIEDEKVICKSSAIQKIDC